METIVKKVKKWLGIKSQQSATNLESSNEGTRDNKANPGKKRSGRRSKGNKGVKKSDPPINEGKKPKRKRIYRKRKQKKEVDRICYHCLEWFIASRRDTKYCSNSCKQIAFKNNHNNWRYANIGEHLFVESISRIIMDIKTNNGSSITKSTLDYWTQLTDFTMELYKNYILDTNEHFNFAQKHLQGFLINLQKQNHELQNRQELMLSIPKDNYNAWQRFLDAGDFDKKQKTEYYFDGEKRYEV